MAKEWQKQPFVDPLKPWFRFYPTDEELLSTYLQRKVRGLPFRTGFENFIPTVDFKSFHPKELIGLGEEDKKEWYYFTPMEAKSRTGTWSTSKGYWKPTGREEIIYNREGRSIGFKKLLDYYEGKHANGVLDSYWKMDEYRISNDKMDNKWVLCKLYLDQKKGEDDDDDDDAYFDVYFPDSLIKNIPNNVLEHLSQLVSSYQSLSLALGDTGRGPQIVNSIIRISRQCKLHKIVDLPKEGEEISAQERDLVVGKVYSKIMEMESRLLPCGCGHHVIAGPRPQTMETIATLINIASSNGNEFSPLPAILAHTLGREIKDVHRGSGKGVAQDMELLRLITEASRCAITTFVERNINKIWRIDDFALYPAEILGFDIDQPQSKHDFDKEDLIKFVDLFCELALCLTNMARSKS